MSSINCCIKKSYFLIIKKLEHFKLFENGILMCFTN